MSGTGRGTHEEVWDGSENLGDVRYVSGDSQGGLGRVEGHSERSRTGRGTLPVVRDWSGDLPGGPRRVP